jgi:hypothetical protein
LCDGGVCNITAMRFASPSCSILSSTGFLDSFASIGPARCNAIFGIMTRAFAIEAGRVRGLGWYGGKSGIRGGIRATFI